LLIRFESDLRIYLVPPAAGEEPASQRKREVVALGDWSEQSPQPVGRTA